MQTIIFKLDKNMYGINTDIVEEISKFKKITHIPNAPRWIEGLINLRGDAITLINLYKLLDLDESVDYSHVIIVRREEEQLGLMVDEIVEVITIDPSEIQEVTRSKEDGILGVIKIEDEIINLIDMDKLISKKEG